MTLKSQFKACDTLDKQGLDADWTNRNSLVSLILNVLPESSPEDIQRFEQHLREAIQRDDKTSRSITFLMATASADHLREALLRTFGRWQENGQP